MPKKFSGKSGNRKEQEAKGKTRSDTVKDLPVRAAKNENVKGGATDITVDADARFHKPITIRDGTGY